MAVLEPIGPTVVRRAESFLLKAQHIDQTFQIDVFAPPGEPKGPLPVVYVTDSSFGFGMVAQIVGLLQLGMELPQMVVVGIGYPASVPAMEIMGLRFREMCPTPGTEFLANLRKTNPAAATFPADVKPGGATAFLNFINDELKPLIEAKYSIDRNDQTHAGMSLGGLLALHGLFTQPKSFQRVVALSPSIWWDNRQVLESEAALAETAKDLPVNLFVSIGALEEAAAPVAKMVSNLYALDATLRTRKYPNLRLAMEVFPQETHQSVFAPSFSRGLRTVFGRVPGYEGWAKVPAG